ncbi:alpha-tocopherol transfer protein-like isoform X1 [Centruroides sculpturatus]|uniref:alpha-tocopherol transfer protein-like isoform X1 n=1 Tax=Centruroides sculpturatus TaxID=218467 RepID=UPI000C6DAB20|nr:alpha-tocopherol transfer protein-like isoform X1 [Centruroides sculpturatus]
MDDIFLLSFLRARKFDRERALTLLKNYYLTRRKYPIVFKNLKPSAIEEILRQNMLSCVKTDNNMVITVASYGHWDATKVEILDVLRVVLLFLDFELNDHPIQVNGLYLLLDAKDISWRHIIQYTPRNIQLVIMSMVKCIAVRYKGIYVVNTNKIFVLLYSIIYPFLPNKIKKRMHLYGSDMKELHKVIDPKYLPAEFNGELPTFDSSEYIKKLKDNEEFFVENEKYWTEENST